MSFSIILDYLLFQNNGKALYYFWNYCPSQIKKEAILRGLQLICMDHCYAKYERCLGTGDGNGEGSCTEVIFRSNPPRYSLVPTLEWGNTLEVMFLDGMGQGEGFGYGGGNGTASASFSRNYGNELFGYLYETHAEGNSPGFGFLGSSLPDQELFSNKELYHMS